MHRGLLDLRSGFQHKPSSYFFQKSVTKYFKPFCPTFGGRLPKVASKFVLSCTNFGKYSGICGVAHLQMCLNLRIIRAKERVCLLLE